MQNSVYNLIRNAVYVEHNALKQLEHSLVEFSKLKSPTINDLQKIELFYSGYMQGIHTIQHSYLEQLNKESIVKVPNTLNFDNYDYNKQSNDIQRIQQEYDEKRVHSFQLASGAILFIIAYNILNNYESPDDLDTFKKTNKLFLTCTSIGLAALGIRYRYLTYKKQMTIYTILQHSSKELLSHFNKVKNHSPFQHIRQDLLQQQLNK